MYQRVTAVLRLEPDLTFAGTRRLPTPLRLDEPLRKLKRVP
jgi:hypothetical protein